MNSCAIFWFSGTGNSLAIARELAAGLDCAELIPIARAFGEDMSTAERVVFVYPVYALRMPAIVARFLANVPFNASTRFYSVATPADLTGAPHAQARVILRHRGADLAAGWTLFMPSNHTPFGRAWPEKKQQAVFGKMKERVPELVTIIAAKQTGPLEDSVPPINWLARPLHRFCIRLFPTGDEHYHVDETCDGCGLCARICPVGNIAMVDGQPRWQHRCESCFACLQWCPQEAIQYKKSTAGKKRYHHPEVGADDLMVCAQTDATIPKDHSGHSSVEPT